MELSRLLERKIKRWFLPLLERLLGKDPVASSQLDLQKVERILVVRAHDQLGDLLLATPVFRALRQHFPEAHLAAVVRKYACEVLLHNAYLDEVICFDEHFRDWRPRKLLGFLRRLRSGFQLAIVLNTVSHSVTSDLIAYLSGAEYVLGSEHLTFRGCRRNFFYNLVAPYIRGERHQSDRNLDIVRHIGVDTANKEETITLTRSEIEWAGAYLQPAVSNGRRLLLFVHPGAGKVENRWDVAKFARVTSHFYQHRNAGVVVAWGPKEDALGERFLRNLSFRPTVAANLSLRKLAAVISLCNLAICNDTGVMHLAAGVGTPLVAIFGPTDPAQWKPQGAQFVALRGRDRTCSAVRVEEVIQAAEELLSIHKESAPATEGSTFRFARTIFNI